MINKYKISLAIALLTSSFTATAIPSCSLACVNGICNQISLFSIPAKQIAQNIDFDANILARRNCYQKTYYLPYVAGDDERCYQRKNKQYGIWVEGFGARLNQDSHDLISGYNGYGRGLVLGLERNFNHKLRLGFAFAYSQEHLNSDLATNTFDMNSHQGVLYGRYQICDIYYSAVAAFALNRYAQGHDILLDDPSHFTGWQFNGKLEAGYDFCRAYYENRFHIVPHVMVTYGHVRTHAYQEPSGLNVQNEPLDDANLGVGLLLSYDHYRTINWCPHLPGEYYRDRNWRYTPYLRLVTMQAVLNEEQRTLASFSGFQEIGCTLHGVTPGKYTHIIGLGIAFDFKDNNYLTFEYDFETKGGFNMHAGFIKYKIEWC